MRQRSGEDWLARIIAWLIIIVLLGCFGLAAFALLGYNDEQAASEPERIPGGVSTPVMRGGQGDNSQPVEEVHSPHAVHRVGHLPADDFAAQKEVAQLMAAFNRDHTGGGFYVHPQGGTVIFTEPDGWEKNNKIPPQVIALRGDDYTPSVSFVAYSTPLEGEEKAQIGEMFEGGAALFEALPFNAKLELLTALTGEQFISYTGRVHPAVLPVTIAAALCNGEVNELYCRDAGHQQEFRQNVADLVAYLDARPAPGKLLGTVPNTAANLKAVWAFNSAIPRTTCVGGGGAYCSFLRLVKTGGKVQLYIVGDTPDEYVKYLEEVCAADTAEMNAKCREGNALPEQVTALYDAVERRIIEAARKWGDRKRGVTLPPTTGNAPLPTEPIQG